MTHVLLTGAGGFVGHHVLEHILTTTDWDVTCTDSFEHRGKTDRISEVLASHDGQPEAVIADPSWWTDRVDVITHDLTAPFSVQALKRIEPVDYVIAMASESSVDRSLAFPVPFVRNNVDVMLNTLELCRRIGPKHVIVISTDEVYGPEPYVAGLPVPHEEWSPIKPSNPYSASKACQEAIAFSYWRSYRVPVTIVNCMNLIGERQDPEKFLPLLIKRISAGARVQIHGNPQTRETGSRFYLHARNLADALLFTLREVRPAHFPEFGEPHRFNIVGLQRLDNLSLAKRVSQFVGRPLEYEIIDFHSARPGHDPHYGLDGSKIAALGWTPPVPFDESLERTVHWSLKHDEWLI